LVTGVQTCALPISECGVDAAGLKPSPSGCQIQTVQSPVVAHPALKIDSIPLIQKSIPELSVPEYPRQGRWGGLVAVGGRILCSGRRLGDRIIVGPGTELH